MIMIMGVHIDKRKFLMTTKPKTFHFDLPKDDNKNLKHETNFIIKYNDILHKHTTKNKISQTLSKYKHGNHIHEHRKQ